MAFGLFGARRPHHLHFGFFVFFHCHVEFVFCDCLSVACPNVGLLRCPPAAPPKKLGEENRQDSGRGGVGEIDDNSPSPHHRIPVSARPPSNYGRAPVPLRTCKDCSVSSLVWQFSRFVGPYGVFAPSGSVYGNLVWPAAPSPARRPPKKYQRREAGIKSGVS